MKTPKQDLNPLLGKLCLIDYKNGLQYEIYFKNAEFVDYRVHTGFAAGRWVNDRPVSITDIGSNMYIVNWVEPTGSIVALIVNIQDRWIHDWALVPQWVHLNPEKTRGHENEQIDTMMKYRDEGPIWPLTAAIDCFGEIIYVEEFGLNNNSVINCPPSELPKGYMLRRN
jgi:phenolic acid decarboxylase